MTYTKAHGNVGSLTPLSEARDQTRHRMVPRWIRFHCAMTGTPSILFSIVVVPIYIPMNSAGGVSFLHTPSSICCLWTYYGHSDWCEGVPHSSFDLRFSNNQGCWAFFHVLVGHLYIFFGEMSIQVFCPFFKMAFLLLSCISRLCILEIKPLSVASFETIFSHSVSCLFGFLYKFPLLCRSLSVSLGPIGLFLLLFLLFWETDLRKHW